MTNAEIAKRKERMREVLVLAAARFEETIRLDQKYDYFCFGMGTEREIHIASHRFQYVAECMQAVVTYNPNWSCKSGEKVEAYFYEELFGKKYKIFALLEKGGRK